MSRTWSAYFDETHPEDYRFLDFYKFRSQKSDFTFSFRKESDKLKKDLDILTTNGPDNMMEGRLPQLRWIPACCLSYGLNARCGEGNPHNYGGHLLAVYLMGHRKYFSDVDSFWKEIELHEELHNIEEEAFRSIMHETIKVVDTAIENAHSTESINTRLTNPKKRVNNVKIPESTKKNEDSTVSYTLPIKEDIKQNEENLDGHQDENDAISNNLREVTESMVGKVERTALIVSDVDLEKIFEDYCNEYENTFEMGRTNKRCFQEWMKVWSELRVISGENKGNEVLVIKDTIYNILSPYIKAFKAPYNILKSGDLEENQYIAQFINPILNNTLDAICNVDWRILEVPIESSKYRRNTNLNPIIDKVLSAKRADGLARLWLSHEEIFIYEQIDLASFGALGYCAAVSLFWLTIHQKTYSIREFGSFRIPLLWEDLPVLSEAISFVKGNTEKRKLLVDPKQKLFAKRKVHAVTQNPPTPDRSKKKKK
ncbi:6572_t:CDS:10 [Funneliformis caledonium]|uniref:6572_t:CDS:1 n=1 Tax=Funneliformis caledonium TaxID=1117310 RepID=A0A9N9HG12_9GLOM|nr:6572_t:CDS:10 [Funneliformis caledonium]